MKSCKHCTKMIEDHHMYCPHCGKEIQDNDVRDNVKYQLKKQNDETIYHADLKTLGIWKSQNRIQSYDQIFDPIGNRWICASNFTLLSSIVMEYKRTCKQCGKVWHSLVAREKKLDSQAKDNCGAGLSWLVANDPGSAMGASYQAERNKNASESELTTLKKCPICHSSNYSEEIIAYEKK